MRMSIKEAFARVDEVEQVSQDLEKLLGLLQDPEERIFGGSMEALVNTLGSQSGMGMPVTEAVRLASQILKGDAKNLRKKLEGIEIEL